MYKFKQPDQQKVLADYMRNDKLFTGKRISTKKFYKLLAGLAIEIGRVEGILDDIAINYDPAQTVELIERWESAIGIPCECFPVSENIEDRRNNVIAKLNASGVVTADDFVELGTKFGLNIEIFPGQDVLTFPYTFPFVLNDGNPKFIMVINISSTEVGDVFTYTFPITLRSAEKINIVQCLFKKLAPANVEVLINVI